LIHLAPSSFEGLWHESASVCILARSPCLKVVAFHDCFLDQQDNLTWSNLCVKDLILQRTSTGMSEDCKF
jgi:hypothetical protein